MYILFRESCLTEATTYFINFPSYNFEQHEQRRACSHEGGGPQVGEVTCGGLPHLTCKRDHIKMRDYNGQVGYPT